MCNDGAWMDKTPKKPGAPSSGGGTGGVDDNVFVILLTCAIIIVVVVVVFTLFKSCISFYNKQTEYWYNYEVCKIRWRLCTGCDLNKW